MLNRGWDAESNGKLPQLSIFRKTSAWLPEYAVEDLTLSRTEALVTEFLVKDFLFGIIFWWYVYKMGLNLIVFWEKGVSCSVFLYYVELYIKCSYCLNLESTAPNFGRPVSTHCGHFQVRGSDIYAYILSSCWSDVMTKKTGFKLFCFVHVVLLISLEIMRKILYQ